MGLVSFAQEIESPISASRLFKALVLDYHNLYKKLMPESIISTEVIEGDGGVGSIKQINFIQDGEIKYAKHRVDELDEKKCQCKYTVIEGDVLKEKKLTSVVYEFELVDDGSGGGGSICKMLSEYYTEQGVEISEEDIEFGKENAYNQIYKRIENYLLANPEAYAY